VYFETERLLVRNFIESDSIDLFEYLSDPRTYKFEPGEPISKNKAIKLTVERSKSDLFLAVVRKDINKMIGHLYFNQIEPKDLLTYELGYIFNENYQHQGYASESALGLLKHFKDKGIHRVFSECNPENISSWKLLERIGMRRESHRIKDNFFKKDDNNNPIWIDSYQYAILGEEIG
jgi:[ribosomal protein S5]-alanine N-acetyltransferase